MNQKPKLTLIGWIIVLFHFPLLLWESLAIIAWRWAPMSRRRRLKTGNIYSLNRKQVVKRQRAAYHLAWVQAVESVFWVEARRSDECVQFYTRGNRRPCGSAKVESDHVLKVSIFGNVYYFHTLSERWSRKPA